MCIAFFCFSGFALAKAGDEMAVNKNQQFTYAQSHINALASAKKSQHKLENIYQKLIKNIQAQPDLIDIKHKNEMLIWLGAAQQNWSEYVYSHCMSLSYAYAYPSTSRLASVEFNVCKTRLTIQRIKFFENMLLEYEIVQGK